MMQDFAEMKGYNGGRKNGRGEGPFGAREGKWQVF